MNMKGQITFVPKLGVNLADISGGLVDTKMRLRTQFGLGIDIKLNEIVSLQPGLLYSGKGTLIDFSNTDKDALTLNYLEIPINFLMNFGKGTGKFQLYAGPYTGICINGKYKYLADDDNKIETLNIGSEDNFEVDIKRLDLGINIGLGVKIKDIQIQGGYSLSLSNINYSGEPKLKNHTINFSIAYYLNKK